jgi:hypothetical protein
MRFTAWNLPQPQETVAIGSGWGQRDHKNTDRGATLPYIVRRTSGEGMKVFATLFEGYAGEDQRIVRRAARLEIPADRRDDTVAFRVETPGGHDVIVCSLSAEPIEIQTPVVPVRAAARFSVTSTGGPGGNWSFAKE